ncbi:MAG: amidohydrolase [Sulfobacillus benefaciens]|uniref:Amidohydrolase n=1 Tax=Sulfobacillus benefaciens TaxID=453960 RepID=A0A2T2XD95_9FIRM|nr:MAG: amidohydrolase [Sulfobacillus benefaciens]
MSLASDHDSHRSRDIWLRARALMPHLSAWRRHLHQHPELSFEEHQTALYISEILRALPGMEVATDVGGTTGVVGRIGGKKQGRHIAIRADMDALPIVEPAGLPFRSETPGVMHACGHDGHMAIGLGTAVLLSELLQQETVSGRVTVIFQPAEETANSDGQTGAPYLVDAGVLQDVDLILALHLDPTHPVGTVRLHDGPCMANVDNFYAEIQGHGGHAGYPDLSLDPVWLMIPVLEAIHGIVARRISPLDAAAVTVGRVMGGTAPNVIPDRVTLEGTLRSYTAPVRERLIAELEHAVAIAQTLGGTYDLRIDRGEPAVINAPAANQQLAAVIRDITGTNPVHTGPFGMGGEDFGFMTQVVPGALFFLGCAPPNTTGLSLHSPQFLLDEDALPLGTAIMTETIRRYLSDNPSR